MINLQIDSETGFIGTEFSGDPELLFDEMTVLIDHFCNCLSDSVDASEQEKIDLSIEAKQIITSNLVQLIGDTYTDWKKDSESDNTINFPTNILKKDKK